MVGKSQNWNENPGCVNSGRDLPYTGIIISSLACSENYIIYHVKAESS